jgi:hypothetical protein
VKNPIVFLAFVLVVVLSASALAAAPPTRKLPPVETSLCYVETSRVTIIERDGRRVRFLDESGAEFAGTMVSPGAIECRIFRGIRPSGSTWYVKATSDS